MVLPTSVPDCTGSSRNRLSWEMAAHVALMASGDHRWRSSPSPFRLSAAGCPPLFPNFRHSAHLRQSNRQHYPDADSDDGEETFIALPAGQPAESYADVFSIVPILCYGRHKK
eukprot:7275264-Pyramimonas_sp.AAC.1